MTDRATYHSSDLTIVGDVHASPGIAVDHGECEHGHVAIYTPDGSLGISADTPEALNAIASSFLNAAAQLRRMQNNKAALEGFTGPVQVPA